jgi:hypothetical protein
MQANSVSKPPSPHAYQASVPISVYRELAAELQSVQAKLSFFQLQNDRLAKQNQLLLKEFEAIAESTQKVQSIVAQTATSPSKLSEVISNIRAGGQAQPTAEPAPSKTNGRSNPSAPAQTNPSQVAQEPAVRLRPTAAPASNGNSVAYNAAASQGADALQLPPIDPNSPIQPSAFLSPNHSPRVEGYREIPSRSLSRESSQSESINGWWLALTIVAIMSISFGAGYFLMRPFANK